MRGRDGLGVPDRARPAPRRRDGADPRGRRRGRRSFALQIARAAGAIVFATCSARSRDFLTDLGPNRVIDYRQEDAIEVVCREAEGGRRGPDPRHGRRRHDRAEPYALRPGGRIVSIVDIPQPQSLLEAWNRNAELHFVFTPPRRATLEGLRVLLESGAVRPLVDSVLPLEQAPAALARLGNRRRARQDRDRDTIYVIGQRFAGPMRVVSTMWPMSLTSSSARRRSATWRS